MHDHPPAELVDQVSAGLQRHNLDAAPLGGVQPLAAFALDEGGQAAGGAVGRTWGACCELLELWVSPALRGAGVGSELLAAFEQRARERGCTMFYLTTLSYQAPDFYRRHGYTVTAEIAGYPQGIRKFLMTRSEAAPAGQGKATDG